MSDTTLRDAVMQAFAEDFPRMQLRLLEVGQDPAKTDRDNALMMVGYFEGLLRAAERSVEMNRHRGPINN